MSVEVRFFAAARAAAGCAQETTAVAPELTIDDLVAGLGTRHGEALTEVLARSTFLVDGQRAAPGTAVCAGAVVDVLPPFAGG